MENEYLKVIDREFSDYPSKENVGELISILRKPFYSVDNSIDRVDNGENLYFGMDQEEARKSLGDYDSDYPYRSQTTTLYEYSVSVNEALVTSLNELMGSLSEEEFEAKFPDIETVADFIEYKVDDDRVDIDYQGKEPDENPEEIAERVKGELEKEVRDYVEGICEKSMTAAFMGSTFYGLYKYKDGYIQIRVGDHFFNPSNVMIGKNQPWFILEQNSKHNEYADVYAFISINIINEQWGSQRKGNEFRSDHKNRENEHRLVDYRSYYSDEYVERGEMADGIYEQIVSDIDEMIDDMKGDIDKAIDQRLYENEDAEFYKDGGVTDGPFQYGDAVITTQDSEETPDGKKYRKGQKGHITGAKKEGGTYYYQISTTAIVPLQDVPADDLALYNKEKKEKVNKALDEKQVAKKFKDVGNRVSGSKKEQRAYSLITVADLDDIELDEITAIKLVTKDKVYPEVNVEEQRAAGVGSGAAYLKVKIREACGSKPPNSKDKRASFVRFIQVLTKKMELLKTVDEVVGYLDTWRSISTKDLMVYFFNVADTFTDETFAKAEVEFKSKFKYFDTYSLFKKVVEEVFGKRFQNFIFFSSDPAKIARQQAKDYQAISTDESGRLIDLLEKRREKFIYANNENISLYENYTESELKDHIRNWSGMDMYRKDMEGFRKRAIEYLRDKVTRELVVYDKKKEALQPRPDDWSWFTETKERKEVEKSNEIKINVGTPLSYIKRTGGLVIKEEYVQQSQNKDPDKNPITNDFGFKSAQFGNALKDTEAREHVRHFLGAMSDIAEILDIDIKQLNDIGGLSIAFAARGSGGASAHYERGRVIINITNRNGDGAIAHELGHYFDNALTIFGKTATSMNYGSEIKKIPSRYNRNDFTVESFITNKRVTDAIFDLMDFIEHGKIGVTPMLNKWFIPIGIGDTFYLGKKEIKQSRVPTYYDELKKEFVPVEMQATIEETFDYLRPRTKIIRNKNYDSPDLQAKLIGYVIHHFGKHGYELPFPANNESAYYYYSSKMSSPYWARPYELFARAWECYIFDKLQVKGRMNNYLVSGEYFEKMVNIKSGGYTYVYPFGEERKYLFDLFEILINAVKEEYELRPFVPFTGIRADEYMSISGDTETSGVEVEGFAEGGGVFKGNNAIDYYAVYDNSNLGYVFTDKSGQKQFGILHASTLRGSSRNFLSAPITIYEWDKTPLRKATEKDFDDYRVSLPPDFHKHNRVDTVMPDDMVSIWSRPNPDHPWHRDIGNPMTLENAYFHLEGEPAEGEFVTLQGYEYAWFREGVDPNKR